MAVDLEPVKQVMHGNIIKLIIVGLIVIVGNLLFRKLEKYLRRRNR